MRLAKLELLAYGPFRGMTLDFEASGLHIVLGRNEAGKSTTLRAITGLLYGIETRTPDAHVHKPTDLRIGGVLESSAGQSLRIVRRKGNTNTLLDTNQQAIDESVLKKLLGGVTRETFQYAFGLDHVTLEAGAKALLEGRGDLGESLFDASVGGGGEVQRLVAELTAEADTIYKPRASSLPLNDALKAFAEAQKTVREKQSLPEAFLEQERGLEGATTERAALLTQKKELEARKARLVRARSRIPFEKRLARAAEKRAEFGALRQQIARVEALQGRFGVYERSLEQRRDLTTEVERLAERIVETARRAGVEPKAATDELRFEARKEARIQSLLRDKAALGKQLDSVAVEIMRLERERERFAGGASKPVQAPADGRGSELLLASTLERARGIGAAVDRLAAEKSRLDRRTRDLEGKVTALGLYEGTLDAFVTLRLPAVETVDELGKRFDDVGRVVTRLEERMADLDREAASLDRQISSHRGEFSPPDAEALAKARAARDDVWKTLRAADDPAERRRLESDVEGLVREADVLADRMIREADRVTALARLRAEAETNAQQLKKVEDDRTRALKDRVAIEQELATLFVAAGIRPLGFAEMRRWLAGHEKIAEDHRVLRDARAELELEAQRADGARVDLASALVKAGSDPAEGESLGDLITRASSHLSVIETARRNASDAERSLAEIQTKLDERVVVRKQAEVALAEAAAKLAELLAPFGIPADAVADEVTQSIETLRELFTVIDKRTDAEGRRRMIESDVADFEREVSAAITELAPDLTSAPLRDGAPVLFARAAAAKANEQELATVTERLEGEGDVALDDADRELASDPEAAERTIDELGERLDTLSHDIDRLTERIGGIRGGLDAMRAESHAAEAAAAAQQHLTRIREGAERWARAKLASVILAREIERYREENQGPLLASSSSLFSRLTLGAFSGIRAGFDDKDKPCLRCVRAGGGEVDVTGLSDGTRDQLYLSLRLASLLRRTEVAEPMPLVLDDVLIQLDDQRAAAALSVLAEVSRRMQVLFFTHHARLVELARSAVAANELVVHELSSERAAPDTVPAPA